jgi:hypothetical protein
MRCASVTAGSCRPNRGRVDPGRLAGGGVPDGQRPGPCAGRGLPDGRRRVQRGHHRAQRRRQVNPARRPRRAGRAQLGRGADRRRGAVVPAGAAPLGLPPRPCRLRLPGRQPPPVPHRGRERRAPARPDGHDRGGRPAPGPARPAGPGRRGRPASRPPLRRPAAARGGGPGDRAPAEVILADEPTGALDAANATGVLDLLLEAQREIGASLVMVTHDRDAASRMDRRIGLRDGRVT